MFFVFRYMLTLCPLLFRSGGFVSVPVYCRTRVQKPHPVHTESITFVLMLLWSDNGMWQYTIYDASPTRLMIFFILITCPLYIVMILKGEIRCSSIKFGVTSRQCPNWLWPCIVFVTRNQISITLGNSGWRPYTPWLCIRSKICHERSLNHLFSFQKKLKKIPQDLNKFTSIFYYS